MPPSLTEDFKTLEELQGGATEILAQVHRTGRPVVITVNGKPDVVIVDAAAYEKRLSVDNVRALIAEGEADVRAGRTRPVEEFMAELIGGAKVSSSNRRKGRK